MTNVIKLKNDTYLNGEIYSITGNKTYNNNICVKYANGLMICYSKSAFDVEFTTQVGSMYRAILYRPFTFPQDFINNPTVFVSTANDDDYTFSFVYAVRRTSHEITRIDLLRPNSSSGSVTVHYIAIGFWK